MAIPGRTITPGVRVVEGCLGNGLFPMYVATSCNQKFPVQYDCRIPIPQNPHPIYNRDIFDIHLTALHRYDNPVLIPSLSCLAIFLNFPCIQILYIFSCRFRFTSKRLSGANITISNNG